MSNDIEEIERIRGRHKQLLKYMAHRLEGELGEHFTQNTIEHFVTNSYERLASSARVFDQLPPLVERFARDRLRALARNDGLIEGHPVEVLFVCERNDAASQMAASLFNSRAQSRGVAHSAGFRPGDAVLAEASDVMREAGFELSGEFPKPISPEIEGVSDVIVTLDAHDDVVLLDGKQYYAWRLPNRLEEGVEGYRALRDELARRVEQLVEHVVPAGNEKEPNDE